MSIIALDSTSQSNSGSQSTTKSLELALSDFSSILSDDERRQLQQIKSVPDASAALLFTAKLDASSSSRRGRSIGARAYSVLQSIQQFSAVVETFVSSNPDIAALVWGSVKLAVLIASNISSYFESLSDLFMSLNKLFPHFDQYQLLFPNSPALQESICIFYASVVQLCKQSILIVRQPWLKKMTRDLRSKLRPQIENIESCANDVKKSIALAKATSDRNEQELQEQERSVAEKHRKELSIFAFRSQKELENARDRQLRIDQELNQKRKMKLLNSLSTYKFKEYFNQARKKRYINTAEWLFSTPQFISWTDSGTPSVFILSGKIGSGKTVLTSSVIDYLHSRRTNYNERITYFFPRFDHSLSLQTETILKSIIRQCLELSDVTGEVETQLRKFNTFDIDMEPVKLLLQYCVSRFSTLYIVVDALDELQKEERNILLQNLSSIIELPNSNAKLFLVGRTSVSKDIGRWFSAFQGKSTNCHEVQIDIEAYTRDAIMTRQGGREGEHINPEEQLALQNPALAQEIIQALINGADGMFLWVDYQIIEIYECTSENDIRETLRTLPKTLGETFDRAVRRIVKRSSAKSKLVSHIFQWVAATRSALTLDELREALSYEPGTPYSIIGKRPNGLEHLTAWSENLVQLDEELEIFQFSHHSVMQHFLEQPSDPLLKDFHIRLDESDHFIGEICVTYLNSNEFKTDLARNPAAVPAELADYVIRRTLEEKGVSSRIIRMLNPQSHRKSAKDRDRIVLMQNSLDDSKATLQSGHPFLEYASSYWLQHTHSFKHRKSITWNLWTNMIDGSHSLARTPWSLIEFKELAPTIFDWIDKHNHFAMFEEIVSINRFNHATMIKLICRYATLGRLDYINILIRLSENKEELSHGLPYAAGGGHLKVTRRLLEIKADANHRVDADGQTALQAAAGRGQLEIVEMLLDAHPDTAIQDFMSNGRTAFQAAVYSGHIEIIKKLRDVKADFTTAGTIYNGPTALQAASEDGHPDIVSRLLETEADIDVNGRAYGKTALQAAARYGHAEIVDILLNAKADVNATDIYGWTALHRAAANGHVAVVERLLEAKAVIDANGEKA